MTSYSNYGGEGDKWPVRPGDLWQIGGGEHSILCGDLTRGAADRLFGYPDVVDEPDLVYADPPWSQSLARYNRSMAGLAPKTSYVGLLAAIIDAVSRARLDVFVEMSRGASADRYLRRVEEAPASLAAGTRPSTARARTA